VSPASLSDRLAADPELVNCIRARAKLLAALRSYFHEDGFLEVDTPSLCIAPDPAPHLASFSTLLDADPQQRLFLPTSPEHHMKRMLAAGFERIYQLCGFFRNGEMGPQHNPEFCGLEWYEAGACMESTMDRTESLIRHAAASLTGRSQFCRAGIAVNLVPAFARISVRQALEELAGVRVPADWNSDGLRAALEQAGLATAADDDFDDLVNRALVARVEPALEGRGPTFLTHYPAQMAALARLSPEDPRVAERFELYVGGLELCNGYGELTDAREQRRRFEDQLARRLEQGLQPLPLDEAFLAALERGMPEAGGNALGVDRLLMLLCERERIDQVLAFPLSDEAGEGTTGFL
jgi:lysyl-tRNA synthetase class 2